MEKEGNIPFDAIATREIVFAKKSGFMRSYILKVIDMKPLRVTYV